MMYVHKNCWLQNTWMNVHSMCYVWHYTHAMWGSVILLYNCVIILLQIVCKMFAWKAHNLYHDLQLWRSCNYALTAKKKSKVMQQMHFFNDLSVTISMGGALPRYHAFKAISTFTARYTAGFLDDEMVHISLLWRGALQYKRTSLQLIFNQLAIGSTQTEIDSGSLRANKLRTKWSKLRLK